MKRAIIFIFLWATTSLAWAEEASRPIQAGEFAPDFELTTMAGVPFKLSDYRGKKPVYLIFWNTWCGHCIHKVPKLIERQAKLNSAIEVIAVNTSWSDSLKEIAKFQAEYKTNYAIAFDHEAKVTDAYGVWGAPTEFIIDINGLIRFRDGLPNDFSPHLANWNTVDNETRLAGVCIDNKETC